MKKLSLLLAAIIALSAMSGCGVKQQEQTSAEGKTVITVADWPSEDDTQEYEKQEKERKEFEEANPDIKIETTTYKYGTDTFLPKAMSGQLPTLYKTYYTEISKIINAGYAADITDMMNKLGMADALYPDVREIVEKDGKLYGIPTQLYVQGLMCNVSLFKEAGLVDADGIPTFPKNYDELVTIAKTIKEKTGKAGFALPTTTNNGGWHFMNIAWSNGVEFMAEENGKWVAKFDTQSCYDVLQYIKDLKWKHNVLPANTFMAMKDLETQFATDQLAMYFRPADNAASLINSYGMSKDNIAYCRVPEGTAGRVAQMGGTVYMVANNATPEQKEACGRWLEFAGTSPHVDEGTEERAAKSRQLSTEKGYMVGINTMPIWNNPERREIILRLNEQFRNVDKRMFEDYEKYDTITIRPEEPQKCQELYSILDSCIQAVLTDEQADPAQLIHQAAVDFQTNYLDKITDSDL